MKNVWITHGLINFDYVLTKRFLKKNYYVLIKYAKPGEKKFLKYRYFPSIHKLTTTANEPGFTYLIVHVSLTPKTPLIDFKHSFSPSFVFFIGEEKKIRNVFSICIMNLFTRCGLYAICSSKDFIFTRFVLLNFTLFERG